MAFGLKLQKQQKHYSTPDDAPFLFAAVPVYIRQLFSTLRDPVFALWVSCTMLVHFGCMTPIVHLVQRGLDIGQQRRPPYSCNKTRAGPLTYKCDMKWVKCSNLALIRVGHLHWYCAVEFTTQPKRCAKGRAALFRADLICHTSISHS